MKIGRVAQQVGITVETIRFYEKQELIDTPRRDESGYREYQESAVQHLSFIKRAKELGFSLKEIKELLLLRRAPETTCNDIKGQALAKIADIDRKMEDMQRIKKTLVELVSSCPQNGPLSQCPIISSIESNRDKNE